MFFGTHLLDTECMREFLGIISHTTISEPPIENREQVWRSNFNKMGLQIYPK
jgi:hypothetical protein